MNYNMRNKTKKTAFALTMVAGMAFGGIMAEKAYSRYYPNPVLRNSTKEHNPTQMLNSLPPVQHRIQPASVVEAKAMTIKDQLNPRKWDYQKRKQVGLAAGMMLGALFLLVKNIRETEMEMGENRKKNQKRETV